MQSPFDIGKEPSVSLDKAKKSFCFGAGREHFSKTVYNTGCLYPDPVVPGPGTYVDGTKLIGVNARKTSLKERKFYLDNFEIAIKKGVPAPGAYQDPCAMSAVGSYMSSEMM